MAKAENMVELRPITRVVTDHVEHHLVVLTLSPQEARDLQRALFMVWLAGNDSPFKKEEAAMAHEQVGYLYNVLRDDVKNLPAFASWGVVEE